MLVAPSANRVYAGAATELAAAELEICLDDPAVTVTPTSVAGVDYLAFDAGRLDPDVLGRQSAFLALFRPEGELLRPVPVPTSTVLDDDLVTIPKYQGKTNEQFTRLLVNVTLARVERTDERPLTVLDPLCGRGTTLTTAWLLGHHGAGVEDDAKAVEQLNAFLRTWLRRKRLKHTAALNPVRREGKSLGRKLEVSVTPPGGGDPLTLGVFTGDTRQSKALWGKRTFDAIVTDAPYGVVHGSRTDVRGVSGRRDRSAAGLLREAVPVWAEQLRPGGALGIAWNAHGLPREDLAGFLTDAGLEVRDTGPWRRLAHRVDSSIQRDVLVATRP